MAEVIIKAKPQIGHLASRVDIIIPFHGQYRKVIRVVESILRCTFTNPFQIYLIDDASPNENFIKEHDSVKFVNGIRHKQQMGFGASLQTGYMHSKSPWLVFMHSDCEVRDINWLKNMLESLNRLKGHGVKMISARTNNPTNDDPALKAAAKDVANDSILKDYLPLYCALCHRELFDRIGGFIKPYPYGFYEDEELAYRMKSKGFFQGVCGKSWVYHEGGGTIKTLWKEKPKIKT